MPVITEIQTISETIGNIVNFVQNSEKTKDDFEEYVKTIGAGNISSAQLQALCIPYITERTIFVENKTVPELYIEENKNLTEMEKEIALGLNNSVSSVFEIKKRLNNGFVIYNLVNEKTYTAIPLVKMNALKEVCPSQFALIRIFKFKETYFMLEISNVIPSYEKETVMNYAVAKIIEEPESLYYDNEEKFLEVKSYVEKTIKDFNVFFDTDEIITSNKKTDALFELFENYQKSGDEKLKEEIKDLIEKPKNCKYMEIPEFSNSYNTFMEKSMEGFSSHKEIYDVGCIADEKLGIYIIPFWATLCEIFTSDNYTEIENYKECVDKFLKNDKIPPSFIERLIKKSGSKSSFKKRLKEITGENLTSDDYIKKYKSDYLKKTIYSSSNVLYCSKTFSEIAG